MFKLLKINKASKGDNTGHFLYLMINLSYDCNFHCEKCFHIENNYPNELEANIDIFRIKELINEAKKIGVHSIVIAGKGEPALNENIKEIVSEIHNIGLIPIVYTNGSTLSPTLIDFYFNHNVSIVIALDSLNEQIYDIHTHTKAMLPIVLNNIENVRKKYIEKIIELNGNRVVQLAINTTISSINKLELEKIRQFCKDDILFVCNPIARFGNATNNWNDLVTNEQDYQLFYKLSQKYSETGGPLTITEDGYCGYSRNGIAISPSGDYMTCAYTSKTNGLLGNIKNTSLKDAFELKHKYENEYYNKYGKIPCLIRHDIFDKYIEKLNNMFDEVNLNNFH